MGEEKRLSWAEKLAYGCGDCAANVYVAASGFLTAFYTDTVGIAAMAIGTMMLVARIFDGVTDLAMGAIVDKTKSKYGKARPWVLWTAPFMMLGLILLFNFPAGMSDTQNLIYAYVTYIFLNCIVYTANNLPYNALLSRMTLNVQDRATTSSVRFIMTQFTGLIINAVTANLVSVMGWGKLSVIFGAVEVVLLLICFFGCKEHVGEDSSGTIKSEQIPFKTALPALLKNKYFFLQACMFLILYITICVSGSMTVYFCNIILGNLAIYTIFSMAATLPAIATNFVNPILVKRFGKRKVMMTACVLMAVGSVVMGMAGTNILPIVCGIVLKGLGTGPIMSGIFAMTADVVDYGEWKTGVRSEGLVNSCTSFGMKVGIGLGSAAVTWILAFGGYEGTAAVQTASALSSIKFGFGYFNAICCVICFLILLFMNIDKHIDQIQSDLQKKHANS